MQERLQYVALATDLHLKPLFCTQATDDDANRHLTRALCSCSALHGCPVTIAASASLNMLKPRPGLSIHLA